MLCQPPATRFRIPSSTFPHLQKSLKHSTTNNKHPLLLPPHPPNNLLRRLRHNLSAYPRPRNAIKLILLRFPPQRHCILRARIVNLQMSSFIVHSCVEGRVEGNEAAMGDEGREMGGERRSEELDVGAGFVDEVEEWGGGEDGRDGGAA